MFCKKGVLKAGLYDKIFLSRPWIFFFERKVSKYFRNRNVCCEILISLFTRSYTIKFHSCDHDNVSFIEKIKNFHFCECAMFIRDRRNTNWTKNIVMAAPVTMNSTLDNPGFLDPFLKFVFKNWDITQFIILLIIKKITLNYYPFPQLSSFFIF